MAFKSIIICVSAFLIQYIAGQCVRQTISSPSACVSIAVSDNGGPLAVTSIGPISPSGIAVATDLGLSGNLEVAGTLPYLSAVAFEGQFNTSGSTPLSYGCGDCVAITQEIGNPSGTNAVVSPGISAGTINTCSRRS